MTAAAARTRAGVAAALAALTFIVVLPGTADLPLDGHEALVVESAREMHARGDWIVPWFNGEPRLNKPPLSYWLTALAARLTGAAGAPAPSHGRAPSIAAAVGLVLLAFLLGSRLFDRGIGLDAALVLAASAGVFTYARDARPDMLYAFWCTAGLAAFVLAWQARDGGRRTAALAMWLAWALATLTKGPHLPLLLLAACWLWLALRGAALRRVLAVVRPFEGLALAGLLAGSWWWLLEARLPEGVLRESQLAGTLLRPDWRHALEGYYLYRPLQLLLPWLLLVPAALVALRRRLSRTSAAGLLMLWYLVPALALSLGSQERWFYMLPVIVPMALLLALGARRINACLRRRPRSPLALLWPAHGLLAAAAAAALAWRAPERIAPWLALAAIAVLAALAWRRRAGPVLQMRIAALMCAAALAALGDSRIAWSEDRYERAALARRTAELVPAGEPLAAWGVTPAVYVYYTGRRIAEAGTRDELLAALRASPTGTLAALVTEEHAAALAAHARLERLAGFRYGDSRSAVLLRLNAR